ncbi:MAG: MFS transporter [Haloferacaceae archaeon]
MSDETVGDEARFAGLSYPTAMLLVTSLGWIVIQTGRYLLPPLVSAIQEAFAIGNAKFGFALSLIWAVYAVSQFPAGLASDDLGYRTTLVASLAVVGVAFAAFALAPTYGVWLVLLAVVGVCTGVFLISSRAYLSALYGGERGRALGIHSAAGDVAGVAAPLLATAVLAATVWWLPFLGLFALAALGAVVLHAGVEGSYSFRRPEVGPTAREAVGAVASWDLLVLMVVYGLYVMVTQGTAAFVPKYLTATKGLSTGVANTVFSLFFLMGVVAKPAAGWASDRVGRRLLTVGALLGGGAALAAATALQGLASAAAIIVFAASVRFFPTPTQAYLFDRFDEATSGSSFGLIRSGYILVGSSGPALVGVGSVELGFGTTLLALAGVLLVAATALWILMRGE